MLGELAHSLGSKSPLLRFAAIQFSMCDVVVTEDRHQFARRRACFGEHFAERFSQFMRHAIKAAGLPIDCKPHGLRKTLGRRMADDGCTAHEIMAVLGHTTLAEAERYTRDADRRRGGRQAIAKLKTRVPNSQTSLESLGNFQKEKEKP